MLWLRGETQDDALAVHTFMIVYDSETRHALPEGFIPLDNSTPRDARLFEIEPILNYLEHVQIIDADFYGFFSPRMMSKTGLSTQQVRALAARLPAGHDICSLSPFPGHMACFSNPILQGEYHHPSFRTRFLAMCGILPAPLDNVAVDYASRLIPARYALMSHYFWADGRFWKAWAAMVRRILTHLEQDPGLATQLNATCTYAGSNPPYQFKIFLLERLAGMLAWHMCCRVAQPHRGLIWRHGHDMQPHISITRCQALLRTLKQQLGGLHKRRP